MIERYQTLEMNSLFSEEQKFEYLLVVEKAVARVQSVRKIIPSKANTSIQNKSKINLTRIKKIEKTTKHEVIAFVTQVAESIGEDGKYLHYGLTSSDVLDTALSLQLNEASQIILNSLAKFKKTLTHLAMKHKDSICAGRTHGMFAELTTFGFKLMGYVSEISRAERRLKQAQKSIAICKLSGAVGTSSSIDQRVESAVAKELKLKIEPFATQVIPRDRHAEVICSLALTVGLFERLAVEFRHLQRSEVGEVVEGFTAGQKGSSAMPHKKNPISAENITGLARYVKSFVNVALENIPLWHERDISHSSNERLYLPDAFIATHYIILRMQSLIEGIYIDTVQMKKNSEKLGGVLYSSHVLLYLIEKKKLSREKAYEIVQKVSQNLKEGESLKTNLLNHPLSRGYFSKKDLDYIFSGETHLKAIKKRIKRYEHEVVK